MSDDPDNGGSVQPRPKADYAEYSLGLSTDGIRQSVAWKLRNYGDNGALDEHQIEQLSVQFSLARNQLRELSWSLGHALGGVPTIVLTSRSKARNAAAAELKNALKDLAKAEHSLKVASDRIARLRPDSLVGHHGLSETKEQVAKSQSNIRTAIDALEVVASAPDSALLIRQVDTRRIPDHRRDKVLSEIMSFWHALGRKLTFTTDTDTSERRGPLIEFVNAIVGCLSDPPGSLGGDSIIAGIKQGKKAVRAVAAYLDELDKMKKVNQST